ncbi:MAG TPA: hypothetical protein VL727_16980 [Puia sp.]|jgi:hypothetical protein|nr:hypothetical protein [Puia sp.]
MKLLVITSLKEYLPAISALLKQAQIAVFSVSKTTGIKTTDGADLFDDWFGSHSGDFDSIFLFSFTAEGAAKKALELVEGYNRVNDSDFPVRAFILPVEQSSQSSSK